MEFMIMIGLLVVLFYFMSRSSKKQEREATQMRNSLEIGDEITTIGGIIGEIVRIKEETVTIETGKDRTKIRILRSAVRSVDVHAYQKRGESKPVNVQPTPMQQPIKKKKKKIAPAETLVIDNTTSTQDVPATDVAESTAENKAE